MLKMKNGQWIEFTKDFEWGDDTISKGTLGMVYKGVGNRFNVIDSSGDLVCDMSEHQIRTCTKKHKE